MPPKKDTGGMVKLLADAGHRNGKCLWQTLFHTTFYIDQNIIGIEHNKIIYRTSFERFYAFLKDREMCMSDINIMIIL